MAEDAKMSKNLILVMKIWNLQFLTQVVPKYGFISLGLMTVAWHTLALTDAGLYDVRG